MACAHRSPRTGRARVRDGYERGAEGRLPRDGLPDRGHDGDPAGLRGEGDLLTESRSTSFRCPRSTRSSPTFTSTGSRCRPRPCRRRRISCWRATTCPTHSRSTMPDFDLVTYGSAKVFIPLQDLIKKYMPNYQKVIAQKPDIPKFTTAPDGNIYTLARLNEGSWMRQLNIVSIYKPWMDKLGKSMPKNTDEFYDLMVAMKNTDLERQRQGRRDPHRDGHGRPGSRRAALGSVVRLLRLRPARPGHRDRQQRGEPVRRGRKGEVRAGRRALQAGHGVPEQALEGRADRARGVHPDLCADGGQAQGAARDLRLVLLLEPPGRVHPRGRPARRRVRAARRSSRPPASRSRRCTASRTRAGTAAS